MRMLEAGYSVNYIHEHYGIGNSLLNALWIKYQGEGPSALIRKKNIRADGALKERIVRDIQENFLTLYEASVKYDVSAPRLTIWLRAVREKGYTALYEYKKPGRPSKDMGRPKKKKPEEMTELERLRYENECLRAENALLKKVRALVEEREARLRGTGQKPSKN
jgi:transposase-like protein